MEESDLERRMRAVSGNKRRRQVTEDADDESPRQQQQQQQQPEVIPSAVGSNSGGCAQPGGVNLVSRETWEEIPEILFVKMQKENPEKVEEALDNLLALIDIDEDEDKTKKKIAEAFQFGAPGQVLIAMKKFQYHRGVQLVGCVCLQRFTLIDSDTEVVWQMGGMEAVFNSLRLFKDFSRIQKHGLCTLRNLFVNHSNDDMKRFVNDLNGLQLVLDAMENFFDDEVLVGFCCDVFWGLAKIKEFREPMRDAGVMGAVGKALDKHFKHDRVKARGELFMKAMME